MDIADMGRRNRVSKEAADVLRAAAVAAGAETRTYIASKKKTGARVRVHLGVEFSSDANITNIMDLSERERRLCDRIVAAQQPGAEGVHNGGEDHAAPLLPEVCRKGIVTVGSGDATVKLLLMEVGGLAVYFEKGRDNQDIEVGWHARGSNGRADYSRIWWCPALSLPDFAMETAIRFFEL
jgi:hypothetical protein